MSNWSRNWFYALAAFIAASLSVGAGAAAAAALPGIGMKMPLLQSDVLPVGYRSRGYGDGYPYGGGDYYDAYREATEYYDRLMKGGGHAQPPPAYYPYYQPYDPYYPAYVPYYPPYWPPYRRGWRRDYSDDYSNSYDDSNYDYSNYDYDDYSSQRWLSYASEPDRYYGTRPPREAYERDDNWEWLPPGKPSSCGEYHYWTGFSCVDARNYKPYIGPKW